MGLSESNPNLNEYPIEHEIFKPQKDFVPNMISIPNMYSKYIKIYWTSKIFIYYMNVGGSITWRLMVESGCWILKYLDLDFVFIKQCFSFHENLVSVLCFHLFSFFLSINMFSLHLILNDRGWCYFLIFESILLMFWLQKGTNHVLKTKRTDWNTNPKVYWIVPVLWRFTNHGPNPIEPKPVPYELSNNPNGADFDKPEKLKSNWIKPKLEWDPECPDLTLYITSSH